MKKQQKKRLITAVIVVAVCLAAVAGVLIWDYFQGRSDLTVTEQEAQTVIEESLARLPLGVSRGSLYVVEHTTIQVESVTYGSEKDIQVHVTYKTPDVEGMYRESKDDIFASVWKFVEQRRAEGKKVGATNILVFMSQDLTTRLEAQAYVEGETDVVLYDTGKGTPEMYLSDEVLNTLLGGYINVRNDIRATNEIVVDGETVDISKDNNIRNGISDCFGLNAYDSEKPDASTPLRRSLHKFGDEFYRNFIQDNHWTYLAVGLGNTMAITGLALLLGIFLGFLTAVVRVVNEKTHKLGVLSAISKVYISVIRGTPVMVQLLIIYFVLLLPIGVEKFPAAVLCFGLNSGAYVSEIIRGGIMAVDGGQLEAGRSLGFGFAPTMVHIILPQAFKSTLPALCNEFISLLKETSVAFYIGVADLTQGGLKIRSITFSDFMPLLAVAIIYLVVVLILTHLVGILERRLRKSER